MYGNFFFWSGVIAWMIISPIIVAVLCFMVFYYCTRVILPSFNNLRFAFFGKHGKGMKDITYYELWYHWNYYSHYLNSDSKPFARCAWRRLVYEAWKESRKHSRRELLGYEIKDK